MIYAIRFSIIDNCKIKPRHRGEPGYWQDAPSRAGGTAGRSAYQASVGPMDLIRSKTRLRIAGSVMR